MWLQVLELRLLYRQHHYARVITFIRGNRLVYRFGQLPLQLRHASLALEVIDRFAPQELQHCIVDLSKLLIYDFDRLFIAEIQIKLDNHNSSRAIPAGFATIVIGFSYIAFGPGSSSTTSGISVSWFAGNFKSPVQHGKDNYLTGKNHK